MSAGGGEVNGAESTTATIMPPDVSEEGKASWTLVAKRHQYEPNRQGQENWPENMGNRQDILDPPQEEGIATYPNDLRVCLPVRVPEDLYNNGNFDIVTILLIMLSFHGINIPTLLYELNADFDNRLLYEAYMSNELMTKKVIGLIGSGILTAWSACLIT